MLNRFTALAVAGVMALTFSAPATQAKELRMVIGAPLKNAFAGGLHNFAADIAKRTEGRYTGKVFLGSLLSFAETVSGLRDGIADVGYVVPAYHRGEFPQANLLIDMATVGIDPVVVAGAANEYTMTCKECLAETLAQNQVFLGLSVVGPYYMMSKTKITTHADFKGKKIRAFGPFGRWVELMGGNAVSMSANQIYEAMSQGQLDGNTLVLDVLKSLSIGEVADYVLDAPIGVYIGNSMFNTNRDIWKALSPADKRSFLLAGGYNVGAMTVRYLKETNSFYENPAKGGVEIVQPSAAVKKATEDFRKNDQKVMVEMAQKKYGLKDAGEKLARFQGLIKKWQGLLAKIDKNDPDAVGKLFNSEIYSKVDLTIYD